MTPFRSVFFTGSDQSAVLESLVRAGEHVVGVFLPSKSRNEARVAPVIDTADRLGIRVFRPKRSEIAAALAALTPELLVAYGYPYVLSEDALGIPRYAINIHPSLLPKYRGPNIEWHIIASGDTESGVTVHVMDQGVDTGPIVYQERIQLSPFETIRSYARKVEAVVPAALGKALERLRETGFVPTPQDEALASQFPDFRTPEDSRIDPQQPLIRLFHEIKACDPDRFPAFFEFEGEKVGVKLFRLNKPADRADEI